MKKFFKTIFLAISSFEFYNKLPEASFWKSLGFYLAFLILATVVRTLPVIFTTLPRVTTEISQSFVELQNNYPANFTLTWDGTTLHASHSPQPIYLPQPLRHYFIPEATPAYLGWIATDDATASPSAEALFTVTQTDILMPTQTGDISRLPLVEVLTSTTQTITRDSVSTWRTTWEAHKASFLHLTQLVLPFVLYVVVVFQRLGLILIEAVIFLVFRKLQKNPWSFRTCVVMAFYFFIPAEVIDITTHFAFPELPISLFSLTVWVYFIAVSLRAPKKPASV